ncbi:MAG: 23S rRNA (pseudouridine(1915)-N(3))-methyltransferase RlmH [Mycoplasmatales bacterium]
MQIDIIVVGKLKEKALVEMCNEYTKRLSRFVSLYIIEVKDEPNELGCETVRKREAEKILAKMKDNTFLIVTDLQGKQLTSEAFAQKINEIGIYESGHMTLVIGGSMGVDHEVTKKAKLLISFSKMTFPHQLFRVMLLEQLYRAYKINANESYHK